MKISLRDAVGISLGIELVVSVLLGLGGGFWLDHKLGTGPWLTLVGIAMGFAAGIRSILRTMRQQTTPPPRPPGAGGPDADRPDDEHR